jgi:hypothetical protein
MRKSQMTDYDDLLSYVTAQPARDAFALLHQRARDAGFEIRYKTTGVVHSVDLWSNGDHLFSWIPNRSDLLFYIRRPALDVDAGLAALARTHHPEQTKENRRGEVTVRVADSSTASELTRWLFVKLENSGVISSRGIARARPQLELSRDPVVIEHAFREWRDTLVEETERIGRRYWMPDHGVGFTDTPELFLAFATSPDGIDNAVHINLPPAGSENPLAGIGVDTSGRRYVLRQAWLQPNHVSPESVRDEEFDRRTRLRPASVTFGGTPAKRRWHVVTLLDGISADDIRERTAEFVGRCWSARLWDGEAEVERARLVELFGRDEEGGSSTYYLPARELVLRRKQGEVWSALKHILKQSGIRMTKPRHFAGYEVDALILADRGSVLVEIKTSAKAADVYAGVGQLMLYPELIDSLRDLPRVLLLPGSPRPSMAAAVAGCGVELHSYSLNDESTPSVRFSPEFLERCGIRAQNS